MSIASHLQSRAPPPGAGQPAERLAYSGRYAQPRPGRLAGSQLWWHISASARCTVMCRAPRP